MYRPEFVIGRLDHIWLARRSDVSAEMKEPSVLQQIRAASDVVMDPEPAEFVTAKRGE